MAPECKVNIAVQTLHVQQLTPKGLLLSFMSCYTLNYPTQKTSMLQQSMSLFIGKPVRSNDSGTQQWAEGVSEDTWRKGWLRNK